MENMVKMQITGENGLEKDGSYEKLQQKMAILGQFPL